MISLYVLRFDLIYTKPLLKICHYYFGGLTGKAKEDTGGWTLGMRTAISKCRLDLWDPLCREALKLEDEFYEVIFKDKKPLGIVLERSGDWAIVKVKNNNNNNIMPHSFFISFDTFWFPYLLFTYSSLTLKRALFKLVVPSLPSTVSQ